MEIKGTPPTQLLHKSDRWDTFFKDDDTPIMTPNDRGRTKKPNSKTLEECIESENPEFLDFIDVNL